MLQLTCFMCAQSTAAAWHPMLPSQKQNLLPDCGRSLPNRRTHCTASSHSSKAQAMMLARRMDASTARVWRSLMYSSLKKMGRLPAAAPGAVSSPTADAACWCLPILPCLETSGSILRRSRQCGGAEGDYLPPGLGLHIPRKCPQPVGGSGDIERCTAFARWQHGARASEPRERSPDTEPCSSSSSRFMERRFSCDRHGLRDEPS